jgi:hypothetical protein
VLGNDGPEPHVRLGLPDTATNAAVREAAISTISSWRSLAEDPLMDTDARSVARGVIRTCEELAMPGR